MGLWSYCIAISIVLIYNQEVGTSRQKRKVENKMTNKFATVKTTRYELKEGTKTVWVETESDTQDITEQQYKNCVKASPFFRRIGGSETVTKNYTKAGFLVVRIVSKSPDRKNKTVRDFDF